MPVLVSQTRKSSLHPKIRPEPKLSSPSAVPAPVLDLHVRHSDETSLSAMWSHAPSGSRDSYFLTIRHGNRLEFDGFNRPKPD